ncbi:sugar phosphate isomerase/epimerase family protein [Enterocloster bolteae]|uniref:sugar phosphate isomerase/epimerase family protein n=1 Tax=Enterocloster bolteae TaxID=208479 RepID=UPI000E4ECC2B|nr:sugar phosphate isomerase/epimerase [Enterocloster bolteae]RGS01862.1 sugar phosphate isomerase/epimerase [Enterocloster bolteae]
MKIGIVANIMQDKPLAEALDYFRNIGIQTIEPGCGGYAGKSHVNPAVLLGDKEKMDGFKRTIADSGLTISALSCHGNPIHPDRGIAAAYDEDMRDAVRLCKELGLDTITCFSGCAGDGPDSKYPNWVTCPWPDDYLKILDYQWNEVLIPYWKEFAAFAKENGVTKIALELHPGFMVYNSETLKRLRGEVGREIGVNFDPSHLLWQGMDPVSVIRELKDAIYHVHTKDVKVDSINTAVNGVLDTKHYSNEINRSWIFRTIGYGNDTAYWKNIFSTLRIIGYDGAVSIEHEDSLINRFEGLEKAVRIVKESLIMEDKTEMWWA